MGKEISIATPELSRLNPDFSKLYSGRTEVIPALVVSEGKSLVGYSYLDRKKFELLKSNGFVAYDNSQTSNGGSIMLKTIKMDCDNDTMLGLAERISGSYIPQEKIRTHPSIDFFRLTDKNGMGLVTAAVLDEISREPLMVGFMNQEALRLTLEKGTVVFWKRTEGRLWEKGETSGNKLIVRQMVSSFNRDFLSLYVTPLGPVCHTGAKSCFDSGPAINFD